MKKLIVLLLALLVVGFIAVAQDAAPAGPTIAWNANIWTGSAVVGNSDTHGGGVEWIPYNYDYEGGGELRLQMKATAADKNSGLVIRTFVDPTQGYKVSPEQLRLFYGWANLFNGMVNVQGGRLNILPIATNGWASFGYSTRRTNGGYIAVKPIEGLEVGYFKNFMESDGKFGLANSFGTDQVGVNYTMKDMVNVVFGYQGNIHQKQSNIYGELSLLAVKDLTFVVEGQYNAEIAPIGVAGFEIDKPYTQLVEQVGYNMGNIGLNLYAGENLYTWYSNDTDPEKTGSFMAFNIEPNVTYKVSDTLTAGIIANVYSYGVADNDSISAPLFASSTDNTGTGYFAEMNTSQTTKAPGMAFGFGPNLTITSGMATFNIGDYFDMLPAYDKDVTGLKAKNINVLYLTADFAL